MTRNATQTDLERTDSADILPDADRAPGAIGDGFDQEPPPSRRRLDSVLLAANLPSLMAVPLSLASTLGGIAELTSTGSNLDRDDIRKGLSFSAGAAFFDIDAETMVSTIGGVRVLPVYGWLDKRDSIVHRILGGLASIGSARRSQGRLPTPAYPRSSWTSIRPAVISPGLSEAAAAIRKARQRKKVVAVANELAVAGAYWIASAASEVVAPETALLGSVGIVRLHRETSRANDAAGVTYNLIHAGEHKVDGNSVEPLSDQGRATLQKQVNDYYAMFVRDVAKGRNIPQPTVRSRIADGRRIIGGEAVSLGMANRLGYLDETISRLAGRKGRG